MDDAVFRPGVFKFGVVQGDDFDQTIELHDGPDITYPLLSLTGYSAKMQIRKSVGSEALVSLTSDPAGGLTIDGGAGTIRLQISKTQTANLVVKPAIGYPVKATYVYDLELTTPDGAVKTVLGGVFEVIARVTQ